MMPIFFTLFPSRSTQAPALDRIAKQWYGASH